ncbi:MULTISPECIES: YdiU family protein [unclassified Paludibacterium]|uniref:protein adenylyltransferase SelO n=1 Tax=unclassified Paludibacterium TaxID=2618429 RepID=UPI001C03B22E|nr:YdiU family protein [Paludibacterium sp. B53371]BEV70567.1 YdiU family protein [Paludibacterium sp. THUN1379]
MPISFPRFGQRFRSLPAVCYRQVAPTPLPQPYWIARNAALAAELGLPDDLLASQLLLFAGSAVADGEQPLAALYAGHQFGVYVPQLGDGRALLLGDLPHADGVMELQLKGAGQTPFSRMGDGRAVLRSSIREYLCSEAMHGLGIPTTRALCLAGSDETVWRESAETAAVVTRVAPSFIRFGSFEVFYHRGQHDVVRALADHVLQHHYPQCLAADQPYAALFAEISRRTAQMVAAWQAVGFCHGVMNSDNMSILGLTLDYGPFGFLDAFDAGHICNHSDHGGRYAYNEQPRVAHWNLSCLASALLPLVSEADLLAVLEDFPGVFRQAWLSRWRAKLGFVSAQDDDESLLQALLLLLQAQAVDFTVFFRRLSRLSLQGEDDALTALFAEPADWLAWLARYRARLQAEGSVDAVRHPAMLAVNPKYILRNYLAEQAIARARDARDYSEIARLQQCLMHPFDEQPEFEAYAALPPSWAAEICLSCSS